MRKPQSVDVAVIGAGVVGQSTAAHLATFGVSSVALVGSGVDTPIPSVSSQSAGLLAGGLTDNFTRLAHVLGPKPAAELWRFGDLAFTELCAFALQRGLPLERGRRLRLLVSEMELREGEKAVAALQAEGFPATLIPGDQAAETYRLEKRVLAVQDDGPMGAYLSPAELLAALDRIRGKGQTAVTGPALNIHREKGRLRLELAGGESLSAEVIVVAAHLGTKALIPEIADALVSYADQWSEYPLTPAQAPPAAYGSVYSANHGYEWGVTSRSGLHMGGGRYLRPSAGTEATAAAPEDRIEEHLRGQAAKTFAWAGRLAPSRNHAALDCRPCDERPIIGPLFGEPRILVATGFMGLGLTWGYYSGYCLAKLISTGRCEQLPRLLWPERLRSLET